MKLQFPLTVYVVGMDSDIDCYYNFYLEKQDIADCEFQEEFVINNLIEFIKVDWFDYLLYGYEEIETNAEKFLSNFVIGE